MTNALPKISVVMAVYNGEKFLREAVETVLNQTFGDFEFLIVDDASTDKSPYILGQFSDSRIKVHRNAQNEGLTRCLVRGCNEARGEYIARTDADDISYPTRFQKQVEFLSAHPDYAVVGSWCHYLDHGGKARLLVNFPCGDEEIREALSKEPPLAHGSAMFVKKYIMECGGYRELFRYAQDYDLWLRVVERYKMANVPEALYGHRFHRTAISHRNFFFQARFAELAREFAKMRSQKGSDPIIDGDTARISAQIEAWTPGGMLEGLKLRSENALKLAVIQLTWAKLTDVFTLWLIAVGNNPFNKKVWKFLVCEPLWARVKAALNNRIRLRVLP